MYKFELSSIQNTVLSLKPSKAIYSLLMVLFVSITPLVSYGQSPQIFNTSGTFTIPAGVTSITVEAWGGGGAGGGEAKDFKKGGGGGGGAGGAYASSVLIVTPGQIITSIVGAGAAGDMNDGGNGKLSSITLENTVVVSAQGGAGGKKPNGGTVLGGVGSSDTSIGNTILAGTNGDNGTSTIGGAGGSGANNGGAGGAALTKGNNGNIGLAPGGGGGGSFVNSGTDRNGGSGGNGQVIISWTCPVNAGILSGNQYICTYGTMTTTLSSTVLGGAWSSSSTSVATVDSSTGKVTAKSGGTALITYTVASSGCTTRTATRTIYVAGGAPSNAIITGSNLQCQNTTTNYSVSTILGASSYTWYYSGSGATITPAADGLSAQISFSSTATSGNLKVTTTNGCGSSSGGNELWITISPLISSVPVATSISNNVQCYYAEPRWNTVSNATGYYLDIATDAGFTNYVSGYNNYYVAGNNGSSPAKDLPAGTLYYRVRGNNSCTTTSNSNTISFSTPSPIGGNVSQTQKICSGTAPANLVLTGYSTTNTEILKWQKSSDAAFSSPVDIAVTTPTLFGGTIGNLTAETYFRAVVRNKFGSWCESFSNPVLISITQAPIITPNKVDETCPSSNNGSISPLLSGGLTNIRYIKLTQKYTVDAYQQVAEIQAFEIFTGTNVALSTTGAVASASSVWTNSVGPNYIPSNVNNGVIDGGTFWHGATSNLNEWVKIDLQSAKNIDYLKIYNRTECCSERGQNMLLELFDASNNLVYSKTVDLYQSGANVINVNVLDVSWADGATNLNRTALDSGTYILKYTDILGCSVVNYPITIAATNASPSIPTIGAQVQPDCKTSTGSVVLSGLPESGTINQTGAAIKSYTITGTTMPITGLAAGTYNFTVTNSTGCSSGATGNVVINILKTATWTGSAWVDGPPTANQALEFSGDYNSSGDLTACSCKVTGSKNVVIKSGHTLTIKNEVTIVGVGTLTFEDSASLIQKNDVTNTGNITYKRIISSPLTSDYTYWSSPVKDQKLDLSPFYNSGLFYSYDDFATPENWKTETAATIMKIGKGYIVRGPQTNVPPGLYFATFKGIPNNGPQSISVSGGKTSNLIGNPYPSAIDADAFLSANSTAIDGTLYFWTHNTALKDRNLIAVDPKTGISTAGSGALAYTSNDYAVYNLTGGVIIDGVTYVKGGTAASIGGIKPTGKIAAGQSFFTTSTVAGGPVNFTNAMRVDASGNALNNSNFYKTKSPSTKTTSTIEEHRVWLDLSNNQGAFKQTLIGYVSDATNEFDSRFDGESFDGNEFVDFYSINQDKNLVIQGRTLPFDENDEVPLGYRTTINGEFTINIDQTDGLLANQPVFIEDKLTNIVFDLKEGNYTFNTVAGTFDDRFVLRYTNKTLSVDETNKEDGILVLYSNNYKTLIIHNNDMDSTVNSVTLFNITGQKIANWEVNDFEQTNIQFPIKNISSGVYIVKVKTTKGESSKKIIVRE